MRQEYQLKIFASDSKYTAQSTLTIHINDENDNAPVFSQLAYLSTISGKIHNHFIQSAEKILNFFFSSHRIVLYSEINECLCRSAESEYYRFG